VPRAINYFNFVPRHNIMPNVEIKLTENQQKAFDVLMDDVHTAIGY
jgi:hypothetical protein